MSTNERPVGRQQIVERTSPSTPAELAEKRGVPGAHIREEAKKTGQKHAPGGELELFTLKNVILGGGGVLRWCNYEARYSAAAGNVKKIVETALHSSCRYSNLVAHPFSVSQSEGFSRRQVTKSVPVLTFWLHCCWVSVEVATRVQMPFSGANSPFLGEHSTCCMETDR
ncbi:unnamed protein product [Scytosiphon promiscuus]